MIKKRVKKKKRNSRILNQKKKSTNPVKNTHTHKFTKNTITSGCPSSLIRMSENLQDNSN